MKCLFQTRDGNYSGSRTWRTLAYGVATFVVIRNADHLAWDMLLVYLAVVGGSELATRLIEAKFPKKETSE
jgi:hypothetical protein